MQQKSGEKGKDCKRIGNPVKTVVKVSGQSQQMEKQSRLQKVAGKCQKQSPFVKDALNQGGTSFAPFGEPILRRKRRPAYTPVCDKVSFMTMS